MAYLAWYWLVMTGYTAWQVSRDIGWFAERVDGFDFPPPLAAVAVCAAATATALAGPVLFPCARALALWSRLARN